MSLFTEFRDAAKGLWSLVAGLAVTGWNFLHPTETTHYPRQVVSNLDTYRGHIDLVPKDDDPSDPRCILCMICATICPSQCITIVPTKAPPPPAEPLPEGAPKPKALPKRPAIFKLDYNTCSLCGLCVQNCPVDSLMFSRDVYTAGFSRQDFIYDLLGRMRSRSLHLVPAEGSGVAVPAGPFKEKGKDDGEGEGKGEGKSKDASGGRGE